MEVPSGRRSRFVCFALVFFHFVLVGALGDSISSSNVRQNWLQSDCARSRGAKDCMRKYALRSLCPGKMSGALPILHDQGDKAYSSTSGIGNHQDGKDIDMVATYTDTSGVVRIGTVKSKHLSTSWSWENPVNERQDQLKSSQRLEDSSQSRARLEDFDKESLVELQSKDSVVMRNPQISQLKPVKVQRQAGRQRRKDLRTAELLFEDKENDKQVEAAAVEHAKELGTTAKGRYSIWRKEYQNPKSDYTLKLMRDQMIMAKAYASIAKSVNETDLYKSLINHLRENRRAIGDANTDSELHSSALDRAKATGHILSKAKDKLYDGIKMTRKLRAMVQSTENIVDALKKQSAFLIQLAAKTVPKPLTCLPLELTTDYFLLGLQSRVVLNKSALEDSSLYHYAIFSDNVLATSVVINSTMLQASEPEKHVFHIVTDKLSFAAMKMWFIVNSPANATIQVENIDDFKWLNSSYCSVLRQLESARMKEYYFKQSHPSNISDGVENLKYRNPKYLSMLNHLRFYLPEVYPKLEKILFLDDDIVVQKDLTPLWSIDMLGMVNAAVETCKESFHRFDKYLNFSHPKIAENFDPNACGWAFGMNMFDLKEWRRRNMTGIYHYWQDMNEDRTLWKLGSLPPGLITFYNLTYPLDRSWHVLGLGYDAQLNQTEIDNAAVVHYNGNYKPWLELAITKYKSYWSRHIMSDNPYLQLCHISQ